MADSSARDHPTAAGPPASDLALVLSGGGARGAYQAGVLRRIAHRFPDLHFPIITGVSAGAINASFIAAHPGTLAEAMDDLCAIWARLELEDIFRIDLPSLARHFTRWATRLASGGMAMAPAVRGLVDSSPLAGTLRRSSPCLDGELIGIERNLERGSLKAMALTALNYSTGQTVTWVQGHGGLPHWHQPRHRSQQARISVDHIMASAALPMFFPAVRLGDAWYGDGGIRLSTPLVPALRLGARRILAVSPHYQPTLEEAERPKSQGYPSPAQVLAHLLDSIFLDVLDEDVRRLQSLNQLLARLPREQWGELRDVAIRVLRPSTSLGDIAAEYEPRLPTSFRYLVRSLGTRETQTSGLLSMLMFQPDYLQRVLALGEADAEARLDAVGELVGMTPLPGNDPGSTGVPPAH